MCLSGSAPPEVVSSIQVGTAWPSITALVAFAPSAHADAQTDYYLSCLPHYGVPITDKAKAAKAGDDLMSVMQTSRREALQNHQVIPGKDVTVLYIENQYGLDQHTATMMEQCAELAILNEGQPLQEQPPRQGTANGSSCDGAGCVPYVSQNAVANGACTPKSRYDFGVDSGGKPYVCLSVGSWAAAPPLVGVRTMGSRCSGQFSAQSPDGIAMLCMDGVWQHGDDIPA